MTTVESRWLSLLTESLPTAVWAIDPELRLTTCRGAFGDLAGLALHEALGLPPGHAALAAHLRALDGDSAACELTRGGRLWRARVEPLRDERGTVTGAVAAAVEVKAAPAGRPDLLDRSGFLAALDHRLGAGEAAGAALVLLDLDGFGALNARLGQEGGDAVLAQVADRLAARVRAGDLLARTGGDEFAVLVCGGGDQPARIAERLREALEEPMTIGEAMVRVRTSAGVVRLASDLRALAALEAAETAMGRAKADGRDRCAVWSPRPDERAASLLRVEAELRRALGRDDLRAHFEPSVSVKSGRVDGFEVLLWKRTGRSGARPAPEPVAIPRP